MFLAPDAAPLPLRGSSSINGMIYQRGNPMDYEKWGQNPGMENWDFAHCLPLMEDDPPRTLPRAW